MKLACTLSIALLLSGASMVASAAVLAPAPNSVQNPGSNFLPGLPGYGSAQGSIVIVYGANLGPGTIVLAPTLPLQTTLSNTSITVTVGATTVNLLMVYTLNSQLAAVLPSNTPVGNGTLTVSYNGLSGSTPIVVVASAVGILTQNETGKGPASATHVNNQLITATNAANSNEEIQIYATGGGQTSPSSSTGGVAQVAASIVLPASVTIGGVNAQVLYAGNAPGEVEGVVQINAMVPPSVTPGAALPVLVTIGGISSQTGVTIAVR